MTLVEVLISLVLLAMIIAPFLSLLLQSTSARISSREMLYANYAATNQMEKLAAMDCKEICLSNGEVISENMLIKSMSIPWVAEQQPCFYFIFQNSGQSGYDCMIIPPDGGKGIFLDTIPESINIQVVIDKDGYQIHADEHSITGKIEEAIKPIIMVNAAEKPEDILIYVNVNGNADVVVYSNKEGINIECDGELTINRNIYYRDYTLFKSVVEVYDAENFDKILARVEGILRIPN